MSVKYPDKAIFELIKSLVAGEAVYVMRAPDNAEAPYVVMQTARS